MGGGGGGGGVGAKARWKFDMMCAGSSESSLVANSISTQISCAGSNVAYACRKQNGRLYYSGKERNKQIQRIYVPRHYLFTLILKMTKFKLHKVPTIHSL